MAISVKDSMGNLENVATNGKANLGVALGAVGTGLGILNGGLGLLNPFGGVSAAPVAKAVVANEAAQSWGGFPPWDEPAWRAKVPLEKYYEDRIRDLKDICGQFTAVREDICALRERTSVNETANHYQNLMTAQAFGFVDTRFATERLVTDYEIDAKTCDFLKATKVLTPNHLATTFENPSLVLDYHEERRFRDDRCGGSYRGYRGF